MHLIAVWQAYFLLMRPLVPIDFEQGLEPLFQKSQKGLFLRFQALILLRWDPDILRGFLKMPGLANRVF
jgi:hypothetical protein